MVSLAGTDRMPMAAALLGFAGALPFVFFAGALWLPPPFPSVPFAFSGGLVYGAVILSFLGGIRWGTALGMGEGEHRSMTFAVSVLPALAGWVALALPPLLGVGLLIASFLLQAQWDVISVEQGRLPVWFGKLRMLLTAAAVLSLLAMLLRLVI